MRVPPNWGRCTRPDATPEVRRPTMLVDEAQICVKGGDGGNGCISFHREKYRPRGGPDGGNGGKGGDAVLVADPRISTLIRFHHCAHWKADSGRHGSGNNRRGRAARPLYISVPPGTVVRDLEGRVLADLANPGDRMPAARGGVGGRGNAAFATPRRRAPRFAERGEVGEERRLRLELKVVADAGLVGMPNAGKSTLLRRICAAKPRVGNYPFTTLGPHLGVVEVGGVEFVVADLPGLVEGASEGKGLGDRFLRHVERCRVLVLVLDLAASMGVEPGEQERVLLDDLGSYSPALARRPRLVVANKADLEPGKLSEIHRLRPDIFVISAKTGEGIGQLLRSMAAEVEKSRAEEPRRKSFLLYRPRPMGFLVERENGGFVVEGAVAENLSRIEPLDSKDASWYLRGVLRRAGVERALEEAGVRPGDKVRLGERILEWHPEAGDGAPSRAAPRRETVGSAGRHRR